MNEKLENVIAVYTSVNPPYQQNMRLYDDLGINSMSIVSLIIALEEVFEMEFDLSTLGANRVLTVGHLKDMVENYAN